MFHEIRASVSPSALALDPIHRRCDGFRLRSVLGLPIVKRLMDALLGGSVRLGAREGGGTVAEVVLPLKYD
jgi:hypothetical protein